MTSRLFQKLKLQIIFIIIASIILLPFASIRQYGFSNDIVKIHTFQDINLKNNFRNQSSDHSSVLLTSVIEILEKPTDIDPELDNGIDIGYIESETEETPYRFKILLRAKDNISYDQSLYRYQRITLTIKFRDEKGVNYINETTKSVNYEGIAYFNFTRFQHRDGARIDLPWLNASGSWHFLFRGNRYRNLSECTYPEDLQTHQEKIYFVGKPYYRPVPPAPPSWLDNFIEDMMNFLNTYCVIGILASLILVPVIFTIVKLRKFISKYEDGFEILFS